MPLIPIPIIGNLNLNVDETSVDDKEMVAAVNTFIDDTGHFNRRFGYELASDLGTGQPVDGLHNWIEGGHPYAVSGGRVFRINDDGSNTELTGNNLVAGAPVTFAPMTKLPGGDLPTDPTAGGERPYLFMSNGSLPLVISGTTLQTLPAPFNVNISTITSHNQWLCGNVPQSNGFFYSTPQQAVEGDLSASFTDLASVAGSLILTSALGTFVSQMAGTQIHITSGTNFIVGVFTIATFVDEHTVIMDGDPTTGGNGSAGVGSITYSPGVNGFQFANAEYDYKVAVLSTYNELLVFGTRLIEAFFDDGQTPFSYVRGGRVENGLEAVGSLTRVRGVPFYLDKKRAIVMLNVRTPEVVSGNIQRVLEDLSVASLSNTRAWYMEIGGQHWFVVNFLDIGRTFVYDLKHKSWAEWGTVGQWVDGSYTVGNFIGQSYCYVPRLNWHLIGSRVDGKIYRMKDTLYCDGQFRITAYTRTACLDHGTMVRKRANRLLIHLRRGDVASTDNKMVIRWRDDGHNEWSGYREISLGNIGERLETLELRGLGTPYRIRKYQFEYTGSTPITIVNVQTDITPMAT
jgi:hypothetical protein